MNFVYRVLPFDLAGHRYRVELWIDQVDPDGQILRLPRWIPGSYLLREFARHVLAIKAYALPGGAQATMLACAQSAFDPSGCRELAVTPLDQSSWQLAPTVTPAFKSAAEASKVHGVCVIIEVYAWDLSVRGAYLDQTRGFFNGTSLYLEPVPKDPQTHALMTTNAATPASFEVELLPPVAAPGADPDAWRVATTLTPKSVDARGFGRYQAQSYDELIDHPVEMGPWTAIEFDVLGVPHRIVLAGLFDADLERLRDDVRAICTAIARLFEPDSGLPPFGRYDFLCAVVGDGYGGLEHRNSTALMFSRWDLPARGLGADLPDRYVQLLGLFSHEYFHAWHVKRIKPAAFVPYQLSSETHTPLLWLFEGFTAYFDDLMLVRAGVINEQRYLKILGKTFSAVMNTPARQRQTLAQASWYAWTKYYRPDENAPNALVSYYTQGAMLALSLDLSIRQHTHGQRSLDDVMRALWRRYGQSFEQRQTGLADVDAFIRLADEAIQCDALAGSASAESSTVSPSWSVRACVERGVATTEPLPLQELLIAQGVVVSTESDTPASALGAKLQASAEGVLVQQVRYGEALHQAGISAGDVLIAAQGIRLGAQGLEPWLARWQVGERVQLHLFRRDQLMTLELTWPGQALPLWRLTAPSSGVLNAWLGAQTAY